MEKLDTIVIRFHDDGRVGYHIEYRDPITERNRVVALESPDFPAEDQRKVADIVGENHDHILRAAIVSNELDNLKQNIEELVKEGVEQTIKSLVLEADRLNTLDKEK